MTAGIPGAGKSTWAAKKNKEGFNHHASDEIRKEIDLSPDGTRNSEVFEILGKRVRNDLLNGRSCIYDATNLIRKYRIAFLETLKNIDCEKRCVLFLCPVNVCKERNSKRTGVARVPDQTYDKMLRSFELPDRYEGFDSVELIIGNEPHKSDMQFINYPEKDENGNITIQELSFSGINPKDYIALSQDNSHHSCTLGEHMLKAGKYMDEKLSSLFPEIADYLTLLDIDRTNVNTAQEKSELVDFPAEIFHIDSKVDDLPAETIRTDCECSLPSGIISVTDRISSLKEAAYIHDLGKLFTKVFKNMKGEPTEFAHFYCHENYGAYIYLAEKLCRTDMPSFIVSDDERIRQIMYTTLLINWHMRPLNVWNESSKSLKKDKEMLDKYYPFLYDDIMLLHECDIEAH